jgi:hypothetical protein
MRMDADIVARELDAIAPRLPATAAVLLSRWRTLVARAEAACAQRGFGQARALFEDALAQANALLLLGYQLPTEEVTWLAPVLYERSCHQVAQLARELRDTAGEGIFLYRAFERLVQVAEERGAPVTLRVSCAGLLPDALGALVAYFAEQGPAGLASRQSERLAAAVLEVQLAAGAASERRALLETGIRPLPAGPRQALASPRASQRG